MTAYFLGRAICVRLPGSGIRQYTCSPARVEMLFNPTIAVYLQLYQPWKLLATRIGIVWKAKASMRLIQEERS